MKNEIYLIFWKIVWWKISAWALLETFWVLQFLVLYLKYCIIDTLKGIYMV